MAIKRLKIEESSNPSTEHWVICSQKRNTIWRRTFNSFADAKAEFDFQQTTLTIEQKARMDWKIERRGFKAKEEDEPRKPATELPLPTRVIEEEWKF